MDFKVGDRVRACESHLDITEGSVYTVTGVSSGGSCVEFIDDGGCCRTRSVEDYKPVEHEAPTPSAIHEHPTGALRESKEGRGRPHLILAGFPRALSALAKHVDCELGRKRNWEKGLPESSLLDSDFRHTLGYVSGVSSDTPVYNLTAKLWNTIVLLEEYLRVQDGVMDSSVLDIEKPNS